MTLDEARRELGIEPSATPEDTPARLSARNQDPQAGNGPRGVPAVARGVRDCDRRPRAVTAIPGTAPRTREEDGPSELAELAARLKGMAGEDRLEERLALLREGIQEHPASAGVRW